MGLNLGDWRGMQAAVIAGLAAYAILVLLLRISGKRTVAKWNAFDLVVTVALGSTLATTILSGTVSIMQGAGAFLALIGIQFVLTWGAVRIRPLEKLIKSSPTLLVYRGEMRREAMTRQRVSEAEVYTAARERGIGDLSRVYAVVLESDGSFSVLPDVEGEPQDSTLRDVEGFERNVDGG